MPLLGDPSQASITHSLKNRVPKLLNLNTTSQPKAIVLVTAHWSTSQPTISNGTSHDLLYDYYGFPPETYTIKYPAPGEPNIAAEIAKAFTDEGLEPILDGKRKWDHGVFVPMILIHPEASIPIVQLSVLASEDASQHIRMGKALHSLRKSNVAIVGSGFASFHNLGLMRQLAGASSSTQASFRNKYSNDWNQALTAAIVDAGKGDWKKLKAWRLLPNADAMHPIGGGEHFMPLLVCAGAAVEGEDVKIYKDEMLGQDIYTYYWGADEVA